MNASRSVFLVQALCCLLLCGAGWSAGVVAATLVDAPSGWRSSTPRDEIRPEFAYQADGGRGGRGGLIIRHDTRDGLDGFWTKTFPVTGGTFYRFEASRRTENVVSPRRNAVVRLLWQDEKGNKVTRDDG